MSTFLLFLLENEMLEACYRVEERERERELELRHKNFYASRMVALGPF